MTRPKIIRAIRQRIARHRENAEHWGKHAELAAREGRANASALELKRVSVAMQTEAEKILALFGK